MKEKVTIIFQNSDDARYFKNYASAAKATDGTVTGVYAGVMCSALKRSIIGPAEPIPEYVEGSLSEAVAEICQSAAKELEKASLKLAGKLTIEEIDKFSVHGAMPMRLAKCLLCAVDDTINWQFSAEATLKDIKALKRIDRNRMA